MEENKINLNGYWKGHTMRNEINDITCWKNMNIKAVDGKINGYGCSEWKEQCIPFIVIGDYISKSKYFTLYKIHINNLNYNCIKYEGYFDNNKIILTSDQSSGILIKASFNI